MKRHPQNKAPIDATHRKDIQPVICYPTDGLPQPPMELYQEVRKNLTLVEQITVPPRSALVFSVARGQFFRIKSVNGPQVGDLNLWSRQNLNERFYTGKTRALHGTHLSTGDQMWSSFPYMRPIATITYDTLDWYGFDEFGGSVHDVIGTRCDPYTNRLLSSLDYHYCCHSNLCNALSDHQQISFEEAEQYVHDVLNVFMCTGFTKDTHQYFMKSSPVRPGDYLEFVAEIDLLGALSACPGGDCSSEHSSDTSQCHPLVVEIYQAKDNFMPNNHQTISKYNNPRLS